MCRNFDEAQCRKWAESRGYSVEFVRALRVAELVGLHSGHPAFPAIADDGSIAVHFSMRPKQWAYYPSGTKASPLIIGDVQTANTAWVFESQYDAFALLDQYGWHLDPAGFASIAIMITRGAGNGSFVRTLGSNIKMIMAFKQNDSPKPDGGPTPADKWLKAVRANTSMPVWLICPPEGIHDWNDWTRVGTTSELLDAAIERATSVSDDSLYEDSRGVPAKGETDTDSEPAEPSAEDLPELQLPSGEVTITECSEKLFAIMRRHDVLFSRNGSVTEFLLDDKGKPMLRPVSAHAFRSRVEHFVQPRKWVAGANHSGLVLKPTVTPVDTSKALLESVAVQLLKPIRAVLNCALILADADAEIRIISQGYDEQSGFLVVGGAQPPEVDLEEAVAKLKELIQDFDFQTPGDRARALASILMPALKMGGHIVGSIPADVAEANESQSGKTYRQKMIAAVYNESVSLVTQKEGGVGSDDEAFNEALVRGRPFIQLDNRRGKMDSKHLEAFLTATGLFQARIPHVGTVQVDPTAYIIFLSSNGVEATRDFANRSSIIRIRKQPRGYAYAVYPEGDVLVHIKANQPYVLGCVFAVVRAWLEYGKPKTDQDGHDFREWSQCLDWIVQHIFHEAALMDGHEIAQARVSNPALSFMRKIALAVEQDGRLGQGLAARDIYEIAIENGIDVPSYRNNGDDAACKIIGQQLARLYKDAKGDVINIEGYAIARSQRMEPRHDGNGNFPKKTYVIARLEGSLADHSNPTKPV